MVEMQRLDITRFAPVPLTVKGQLDNKRAARTIAPGTILHDRLFTVIPVVEKGDEVSIEYSAGRVSVAVAGIARERGGIGDRIWVENRETRRLIRVEIRDRGRVSIPQKGASI
jgi:flagella basal body P-ring formation protein FlgA